MSSLPIFHKVTRELTGTRLDVFVAESVNISRNAAAKLITEEKITVNKKRLDKATLLQANDIVEILLPEPIPSTITPQHIPLDIVYEDEFLLVVNKEKGMCVHPAPGHPDNTLVNALLAHCQASLSGIGGVLRPGIVHRLDKDTSGLLVVAKDDVTHRFLADQIQAHTFGRQYEAICYGTPTPSSGVVEWPVGRHLVHRKKMAVFPMNELSRPMPRAKNAKTHYNIIEQYENNRRQKFSHLSLRLTTGRTHQIRVHMAHMGHPLVGDAVYGPKKVITSLQGQCLFACMLEFLHPNGKLLCFSAPQPNWFSTFLNSLQKTGG